MLPIETLVETRCYPLDDPGFRAVCRDTLERTGALVLPDFMTPDAVASVRREGITGEPDAFFCTQRHNVYLCPPDPAYPAGHPRNREVASSKGCIADDQIPPSSALRALYEAEAFRGFLRAVLGEDALYPYADPLSSINLHYARPGQELGWHFDNSSFAITLMIEAPERGGVFEYASAVRDADAGDMNFAGVARVLDGARPPKPLVMDAGTLVLFRGRNALHRVTPVEGARTRMLVVLAYNTEPAIALSESARMTFYGRLG